MLNRQQTAAINYLGGPLLVLAGAGSGKTRVITEKIAYLIERCGYAPQTVCAVTFTNKAANEMRTRLRDLLPANKRRGLQVATFHTLGLSIMKKNLGICGLKKGFSIFDSEDCRQLLRGFLPPNKGQDRDHLKQIQQKISFWKTNLLDLQEIQKNWLDCPLAKEAAVLFPSYQQALKAYNAVDFDDLIALPVKMLNGYPEVSIFWQNKIRHLLVDEYQDSNFSQYQLVKLLVGSKAQFTVVGDDDQAIYAWRGAKPENLLQLQQDYPQLKLIKLEQNYRSMGRILHVANQLISNNSHLFSKRLWSDLGYGDLLRVICCKDEIDEAEQVIADLINHKLRHGTHYGDYAVLYRGNHQSRPFEKILRQHGIAYRQSGGQSWFSRTEVKDIFAYLKLLCNEADNASFLRVINTPKRGIGETSLDALAHYAQMRGQSLYQCAEHLALGEHLPDKPRIALQEFKRWLEEIKHKISSGLVMEALREMVEDSGYEAYIYEQCDSPAKAQKRMDNVSELLAWVERLLATGEDELSLPDVTNKLILIDILEKNEEDNGNALQLSTLHAAKGLEFPYVYLVGMEEDLLPHRVSIDTDQIEEERRLAYVGITRAKKDLCLTLAKQRRRGGELYDCQPSRFLQELPQDSLEWFGKISERNEAKSKALAKAHLTGLKQLLGP